MKARTSIPVVSAAVLLSAAVVWLLGRQPLPSFTLSDGAEFRVIQITYTPNASNDEEHNIGSAPKAAFWLWRHLPATLQDRVPYPAAGIGGTASQHPALSIWWARIDTATRQPILGPAGDVLMTVDSGEQINLGWPDPVDDYRQIFVTDPPTDSRRLIFAVPVEGDTVRFSIQNPAFRR